MPVRQAFNNQGIDLEFGALLFDFDTVGCSVLIKSGFELLFLSKS
jgi:hypothetical protein